ncbi:MAG: hypothetical protein RLZZ324_1256, partial [Candidatus Parcubacteria bacterium]
MGRMNGRTKAAIGMVAVGAMLGAVALRARVLPRTDAGGDKEARTGVGVGHESGASAGGMNG